MNPKVLMSLFFTELAVLQPGSSCYTGGKLNPALEALSPETTTTTTTTTESTTITTTITTTTPAVYDCGHSQYFYNTNEPGSGIVGGTTARENEYPWIVRLSTSSIDTCGATIITEKYLLTSASCVGDNPSYIRAYIADHDRYSDDSGEFSVTPMSYTIHPQYEDPSKDYDFAMLRLDTSLNFTSSWTVQKACLPTSCSDNCKDGSDGYIAGWGLLFFGGSPTSTLHHAKVPIQNRTLCSAQYSATITDSMLCAGDIEGGTGICSGDGGGPLVTLENGAYVLCGVASWSRGCAEPNYFGVYGNVCSVISWIKSTAGIV